MIPADIDALAGVGVGAGRLLADRACGPRAGIFPHHTQFVPTALTFLAA